MLALIKTRAEHWHNTDKKYVTFEQTVSGEKRALNEWLVSAPRAISKHLKLLSSPDFASNFQRRSKSTVGVNKLIPFELALTRPAVFKPFLPPTLVVPAATRKTRLTVGDWNRLLFVQHCGTSRGISSERNIDDSTLRLGISKWISLWSRRISQLLMWIMYRTIVHANYTG